MLVLIRGAGDIATGVALRLHRCGFSLILTELPRPTAVRRTVAFSEAVYHGSATVEGVTARLCGTEAEVREALLRGAPAVIIDPAGENIAAYRPDVLVDAMLAKRNLGTRISDAPLVVALGPGFMAGADCHCVVETMRGHTLGRCIYEGSALPNTGVPGSVGGYAKERVLYAPAAGVFHARLLIGEMVAAGDAVADVGGVPLRTEIAGCLRGILPDGLPVPAGMKVGDVDPRCAREHCFTVSDKALAIAGGVLEAIFHWRAAQENKTELEPKERRTT